MVCVGLFGFLMVLAIIGGLLECFMLFVEVYCEVVGYVGYGWLLLSINLYGFVVFEFWWVLDIVFLVFKVMMDWIGCECGWLLMMCEQFEVLCTLCGVNFVGSL